jgi:predicted ArsR family transcriptional regulator
MAAAHRASPFNVEMPRGPEAAVAQVADAGALHTPLVHRELAAPVVGAVVSDNAANTPDAAAATDAVHVLAPTVQLNAVAAQSATTGAGAVQVAELACPQVPLVHT